MARPPRDLEFTGPIILVQLHNILPSFHDNTPTFAIMSKPVPSSAFNLTPSQSFMAPGLSLLYLAPLPIISRLCAKGGIVERTLLPTVLGTFKAVGLGEVTKGRIPTALLLATFVSVSNSWTQGKVDGWGSEVRGHGNCTSSLEGEREEDEDQSEFGRDSSCDLEMNSRKEEEVKEVRLEEAE